MDYKFWSDVYKTAKPWVVGVIVIGVIIGACLNPESTQHFLNSNISKNLLFYLSNSFLIAFGLSLWDSKKFPFTFKRIFSLFLLFFAFGNILQNIFFK
jgi:hypothetical protein